MKPAILINETAMKIIAIEEHFTSPAVFAHLGNTKASGIMTKLRDMGALRLKEMDEAGIDYALLSENNPAAQKIASGISLPAVKKLIAHTPCRTPAQLIAVRTAIMIVTVTKRPTPAAVPGQR